MVYIRLEEQTRYQRHRGSRRETDDHVIHVTYPVHVCVTLLVQGPGMETIVMIIINDDDNNDNGIDRIASPQSSYSGRPEMTASSVNSVVRC